MTASIRTLRPVLVEQLEGRVEPLLDVLVEQELLNRDDREEVLSLPGPRARVRKLLDVVECKGEEAAKVLLNEGLREGPQRRPEGIVTSKHQGGTSKTTNR